MVSTLFFIHGLTTPMHCHLINSILCIVIENKPIYVKYVFVYFVKETAHRVYINWLFILTSDNTDIEIKNLNSLMLL